MMNRKLSAMPSALRGIVISAALLVPAVVSLGAFPAMAAGIQFKGYGVWRNADQKPGDYVAYKNITWQQCVRFLLKSNNGTGVEYGMRPNGTSFCEVHHDKLDSVEPGSPGSAHTVWLKTK